MLKAKFVRFFAAVFMLGAGLRVAPFAAAGAVDHAVRLLDAKEPFLVDAGVSRLLLLARLESARRKAIECGAVPRLLHAVDEGRPGALQTLAALVEIPEGLDALVQAGSGAVLRRAARNGGAEAAEKLLLDVLARTDGGSEIKKREVL